MPAPVCIIKNSTFAQNKAKLFNTDINTIETALFVYYNKLHQDRSQKPSDAYLRSFVDYLVLYESRFKKIEDFRKKYYAEPRVYDNEYEFSYAITTAKKYFMPDQIKVEILNDNRRILTIKEAHIENDANQYLNEQMEAISKSGVKYHDGIRRYYKKGYHENKSWKEELKKSFTKNGVSEKWLKRIFDAIEMNPDMFHGKTFGEIAEMLQNGSKESLLKIYNKQNEEKVDEKLEEYLFNFLADYGIEIKKGSRESIIKELKEKFKTEDVEGFGLGAFDVINKVIYLAEGRTKITAPEEFAHAFVKLMGTVGKNNKLYKALHILARQSSLYKQTWKEYRNIYRVEKLVLNKQTGKRELKNIPDTNRIREEVIGKALAAAITDLWDKKTEVKKQEEEPKIDKTFKQKVLEWFNHIIDLFKKHILRKKQNKEEVKPVSFRELVYTIAQDIIDNNRIRLENYNSKGFSLQDYQQTLDANPEALKFMLKLSAIGNVITGSLAVRQLGTLYRKGADDLHDIDMVVPPEVHNINLDSKEILDVAKKDLNKFYEDILLDYIKETPYFKKILKEFPKMRIISAFVNDKYELRHGNRIDKITASGIMSDDPKLLDRFESLYGSYADRLEYFTKEELSKIYIFDFFINRSVNQIYDERNKLRLAHFEESMAAKLDQMGRPKDQFDYLRWKAYKTAVHANNSQLFFQTFSSDEKSSKQVNQMTPKGLMEDREISLTIDGKETVIPYTYCGEESDQLIREGDGIVVFKPNGKTSDMFSKAQKQYPKTFKILEQDGITQLYLSDTIESHILMELFQVLIQHLDKIHSDESRASAIKEAVTYIAKSNKKRLPQLTPMALAKKRWELVAEWNRQHVIFDQTSHKYTIDGKTNTYSVSELASIILEGEKPKTNGNMAASGAVGTATDDMLRALLNGTFNEEDFNDVPAWRIDLAKQLAKDIIKEIESDSRFKDGYHIITDEDSLRVCGYIADPISGQQVLIAGTMDMIIVDNKGVSHLFDFKTKKANNGKEIKDTGKYKTLSKYALQTYLYKVMNNKNSINNIVDNELLQINYTLDVPVRILNFEDVKARIEGENIIIEFKTLSDRSAVESIPLPRDLSFYKTVRNLPEFSYDINAVPNNIKSQYISKGLLLTQAVKLKRNNVNLPINQPKKQFLVYLGRNTESDDRKYNYYTLSKEEAKDYGDNVSEQLVNVSGFLDAFSDDYYNLRNEFKKNTGKTFDILDNSTEGLKIQEEFFDFLKDKGYKGLDFLSSNPGLNTDYIDTAYLVSFEESNLEMNNVALPLGIDVDNQASEEDSNVIPAPYIIERSEINSKNSEFSGEYVIRVNENGIDKFKEYIDSLDKDDRKEYIKLSMLHLLCKMPIGSKIRIYDIESIDDIKLLKNLLKYRGLLTDYSDIQTIDLTDDKELLKEARNLNLLSKVRNVSTEDEPAYSNILQIPSFTYGKTADAIKLAKSREELINTVGARKVRTLATSAMFALSDLITQVYDGTVEEGVIQIGDKTDDEVKRITDDLKGKDRIEIITTIGLKNLEDTVKYSYFNIEDEYGLDADFLDESEAIVNNWDAFLEFGRITLAELEKIEPSGNQQTINQTEYVLFEGEDELTIQGRFGSTLEYWQVGFRSVSTFMSMGQLVKSIIGNMKVLDEENDPIVNDYGIEERLDAGVVTGKILSWVKECTTAEEMVNVLLQKMNDPNNADERWLLQLVNDNPDLTDSEGYPIGIGKLITEDVQGNRYSDNEQFRSQFFTTMRKYFQKYGIVFKKGKNTSIKILNESEGVDPILDNTLAKLKTGSTELFDDKKNLKEDIVDQIVDTVNEIKSSTVILNSVAEKVLDVLNKIGIDDFDVELAKLMLLNDKLKELFVKQCNYLAGRLYNLDYNKRGAESVANDIRSDVKKVIEVFNNFIKMGYEAVFYLDGKLYYSYVMPSYISRLNLNIKNNDDYMKDTFSEVDFFAGKVSGKTVYFNKWIERLATSKKTRLEVFDHKVQLSDRGKNYRKKTAAEYSSSMIREFYYDVNNLFAWYRIPMMSNKPSEEYIKFYRVNNNFRETISKWLLDTTFQEVLRISDVITRAQARLNGTMSETECTENYDLDLSDYVQKDDDGNTIIVDRKLQFDENKKPSVRDLLKLASNGARFVMLDFLEDDLLDYLDGNENNNVGKYLYEKIVGSDKKFKEISEAEQLQELQNTIIRRIEAQVSNDGRIERDNAGNVKRHTDTKFQQYLDFLISEGYILEDSKTGEWTTPDSDILGKDKEQIKERLAEFFWNDIYASISIMQLYITDPAYYKNAEDLQKRLALLHAPGSALNLTARDANGNMFSADENGKHYYRGITILDEEIISDTITQLNEVYDELLKDNENNPATRSYLTTQRDNIISALKEVNVTDAQTFCTPTGMRKRLGMLGEWTNERQEAYESIIKGEITQSNLNVLMQPTKPFLYTQINKPSYHGVMKTRRFGVQIKTSEYMLIIADAIIKGAGRKNTKLSAIFDAIEDTMGEWNEDRTKFTPNGKGIDAISFNSSVKTGLGAVLDLNGDLTYEEIKSRLKKAIYADSNTNNSSEYNPDYIYKLDYADYNIQLAVPSHFFGKQQIGSQTKALSFADMDKYKRDSRGNFVLDANNNKVEATILVKNEKGILTPMTVAEAEKEFFLKMADNIEISKQKLIKEFNLDNVDVRIQNIAISELLKKQMLRDTRFGADLLWAVDTDENGEFNIPLSDSTHSERIQQLMYSIIKSRIYKQEIHGGPVVLVANWGTGYDLQIRYTNKEGKTLLTEEEFKIRKKEFDKKGNARSITYHFDHADIIDYRRVEKGDKVKTFANYKEYKKYHSGGGIYYECYAPIFDEGLLKQYEKDGVIDINRIREENPELLELIGYRIPTEAKYSMASLRIVGFLPREAGEGIMLPKEWTAISGSDYDIDKLYIMRRSYEFEEADERIQSARFKGTFNKGKTQMDKNNDRMFDILQGVLESKQNITKVLKNGNFDTLKEEAYRMEAYKVSDDVAFEELEKMSSKKLKNRAMLSKNLIYNHVHTLFFKQNMVAADLIGVFAQSNVSHAYLSMYALSKGKDKGLPLMGIDFNSFNLFGNYITSDSLLIDAPFSFDGTPISDNIALFLAASVDAVKDPILNLVNINMLTVNIAMAMARMGFNIKLICMFLGQDVIKDVITEMNSSKKYLDEALLIKQVELLANLNKVAASEIQINNTLSEDNLKSNIKNRTTQTDLAIIQTLIELNKIANAFRPISHMTRFNSISAAKGPSIVESLLDDLKTYDFMVNIALNNPDIYNAVNNSMLQLLRLSLNLLEQGLMLNRFALYSNQFRQHFLFWLANMGYDMYTVPKKDIKNFSRFYMDFAVNAISPLFDLSYTNRLKVVSTYPEKIMKLKSKKEFRNNKFILNLVSRFDHKDLFLGIDIDVRGKGDSYVEEIREDFTEFAKKHPKYTKNIIEYMFNRGGFGYSPKTFTNLITNYIKTNLMSDYISNVKSLEGGEKVLGQLVYQFILNNIPLKKLPRVSYTNYSIEGNKDFADLNPGDQFTLINEEDDVDGLINGYGIYMLQLGENSLPVQVIDIQGTNKIDRIVLQVVESLGGNGQGIELNPNVSFVKSIYKESEDTSDEDSVDSDERELPDRNIILSKELILENEARNITDNVVSSEFNQKMITRTYLASKNSNVPSESIFEIIKKLNIC